MNRTMYRLLLAGGALCAIVGCGDPRVAGGNSSETPNTLTGTLLDTLGKPRAGDTITLRPARWTADDQPPSGIRAANVWRTVTDSEGRWSVVGVESGSWSIESRSGRLGRLCATVSLGAGGSEIAFRADTVYPHRRIAGAFAAGMFPKGARGKVYIYGTDVQADIDTTGRFVLEEAPVGDLRLVAQIASSTGAQARAEDALTLPPRDSVNPRTLVPSSFQDEDYDLWPNRRAATLRFSGAGGLVLNSTIDTFPILVRLTGDPVSASDPTGSSIRFADGGGAHLPYEIERWDPVKREADIWLLMRSARKLSDAHGIVVYWGLPDAPDWSNGAAVFDTARGWVGVWHFSGGDPLRDVTGNRLRLSGSGWERVPGIAGDGIRLNPSSRLSAPGALASMGGWSMASSWVRVDSVGVVGNVLRLASRSQDTIAWSLRVGTQAGVRNGAFKTRLHGSAVFPSAATLAFRSSGWTHLGGAIEPVRDRPRIRFLLDSAMIVDDRFDSVSLAPADRVIEIGGGWSGVLDEVRVRRWTLHPDALRLEWGTGRPEATVVWWDK